MECQVDVWPAFWYRQFRVDVGCNCDVGTSLGRSFLSSAHTPDERLGYVYLTLVDFTSTTYRSRSVFATTDSTASSHIGGLSRRISPLSLPCVTGYRPCFRQDTREQNNLPTREDAVSQYATGSPRLLERVYNAC